MGRVGVGRVCGRIGRWEGQWGRVAGGREGKGWEGQVDHKGREQGAGRKVGCAGSAWECGKGAGKGVGVGRGCYSNWRVGVVLLVAGVAYNVQEAGTPHTRQCP